MDYKNQLGLVGHIAANSVLSAKYKDVDGNVKEILPEGTGNGLDLDKFRRDVFPSSADTHPADGDNLYPGSLADGEITERYLLSDVITDPTKVTNLAFQREVGSKMNMVGDGLEFQGYLLKTPITKGVKGTAIKLPINYDPKNVFKDGYYTTTSPYPMHIKAASFKVGTAVKVSLNGLGENINGKNHAAPSVEFTFKADQTMDVKSIQGYDNDGASDGMNGYTYDLVFDLICTYSTQEAVNQLPNTINLFTGSSSGDVILVGSNDFFTNIPNGVEITFDDYGYCSNGISQKAEAIKITDFGLKKSIIITKEKMVTNFGIDLSKVNNLKVKGERISNYILNNNGTWNIASPSYYQVLSIENEILQINNNSINFSLKLNITTSGGNPDYPYIFVFKVSKIRPI